MTTHGPTKIFSEYLGAPGHWGNVTSTIDWCEHNYVHSDYVAEFWNTISSVCVILAGLYNAHHCQTNRYESRLFYLSLAIAVTGVGSVLFHATLKYEMQLLDELPMLWIMCIWWYCWIEVEHKTVKRKWLAPALLLVASFITVIHAYYGFVAVFHWFFASLSIVGYGFIFHFIYHSNDRVGNSLGWTYLGVSSFAVFLWGLDQLFCEQFYSVFNPQLHAVWHILVAFTTYVSVPLVCYVRAKHLKANPKVNYDSLSLPFVTYKEQNA